MSERRKKSAATNKIIAYICAGLIHAAIIGVMVFNVSGDKAEQIQAFDADKIDIVKARAVDEDQLQKTRDEIRKKDQEKKKNRLDEEKRLRELKQQAEREKKRLAELAKQTEDAEQAEKERAIALQKKKKEEELKEKKRKEKAKRDAEKKRKELKRLAEEKKKREAELARIKKEKEAFETAQRQREQEELTKRLEQEEAERRAAAVKRAAAERTTTAQNRAIARIGAKISQAFRVDPSLPKNLVSVVSIKVSSSGDVESVRTIESSGDAKFDQAGERAVLLASPLPVPTEEEDLTARSRFLEQEFEFELFHPFARR